MKASRSVDIWDSSPTVAEFLGSVAFCDDRVCVCCGMRRRNIFLKVDLTTGIICDKCYFTGQSCDFEDCDNPRIKNEDICRSHYLRSEEVY